MASNVNAWSNSGFSGLVSGMDTEAMVQKMLQNTQNKIDKQNTLMAQSTLKQNMYRDIITKLSTFQNKFFNYANPLTNIMSPSFWNTVSLNNPNKAISVINNGTSINNSLKIDAIHQLASASKQTGVGNISSDIKLDIDASKLPENNPPTDPPTKPASVTINLDGIEKKIELKGATNDELVANFNESLTKAYGNGVSAKFENGKMVIETTTKDRNVTLRVNDLAAKDTLGMSSNLTSNKVTLKSKLSDLNLTNELNGDFYAFKINGEEFSFTGDSSLSEVINEVNKSAAGVKMSYDSVNDRFIMEATQTGQGMKIETEDSIGNLMSSIFGAKGSGLATSGDLKSPVYETSINGSKDLGGKLIGGKLKFKINGVEIETTFSDTEDIDATNAALTSINSDIKYQLEANGIKDVSEFEFKINDDGTLGMVIGDKTQVEFGEAEADSLQEKLGIASKAENIIEITEDSPLLLLGYTGTSVINVNGTNVTIDENTKLKDLNGLLNGTGVSASFADGKLTFGANGSTPVEIKTVSGDFMKTIFGSNDFKLNQGATVGAVVDGKNAIVVVDGVQIERNTNEFDIDGFQVTLNETYNSTKDPITGDFVEGTDPTIEIKAERDTTKIKDTIKDFVKDYNELIQSVRDLTTEKTEYKKYPPLTDAQKKEMSESEVKSWEEKSKTGLLRSDQILGDLLSDFRNVLYTKSNDDGLALYDLGITTAKDGTLVIDDEKLTATLETDIDKVADLFSNAETGLASKMNKYVDNYAKSSITSPGRLVQTAGIKNSTSETKNSIFESMKSMEKVLKNLKSQYEIEKKRYWKQFNTLEQIISNSNSTSSWLSSQFQ